MSPKEFEYFTQRVYQKLVNNIVIKPTTVLHNKRLKGKSGCEHQIDLYCEYVNDGEKHRIAIECKNYGSKVSIGKVRDFFGVIHDLENIRGIMVTSIGFQRGAKQFAEHYGISLKVLSQPGVGDSISSVTTASYTSSTHHLYRVDEKFANKKGIDLDRIRHFYASFQQDKANYWLSASHLPIETIDYYIRDSDGIIISSLDSLGLMFLREQKSGTILLFPFKDGWIESRKWGPIKIREVKFEYENKEHVSILDIAAKDLVEAIVEDVIAGENNYIAKSY